MNIVVTGEGIVSAIGNNKEAVLQSLKGKQSGIGEMVYLSSSHKELPVGEVKLSNEDMKRLLNIPDNKEISRTSLMGMMATREAIEEAKMEGQDGRIILISGTTVGGMDITEQWFADLLTSDRHLNCLKSHDCGSCTKDIATYCDIFTDTTTISTACSSAANAIMLGARLLETGEADIVVAGGTEALSRFHLNGFNSLMILDHERCRPFDDTRAGLNLGEGAAYVVLETEEHARHRRADIHAYITGYGNACDAFHQTASSENGEGAYLSMKEALLMAGLSASDIDYVNAHGTGTPNNDLTETVALQRIFGQQMPPVSSTKAYTGHATSAAGAIETVICLLAMRHRFIPDNLGWNRKMPQGITPAMGKENVTLHHVLCNSFGFGGNDTSLVFSDKGPESKNKIEQLSTLNSQLSTFQVEITRDEELSEISRYVKPLEARRMGRIMKSALLASLKVLEMARIEKPDAIITATAMGCLENSELLLKQLTEEGEETLKPTWFMQSTHNTIGSNIAIRLGCHGYNVTYSHGEESLKWALHDAELLLKSGKARNVLVGLHDETTPLYRSLLERMGATPPPPLHSVAMVLTLRNNE